MPAIARVILTLVAVTVAIYFSFRYHWLLGVGATVFFIGIWIYNGRSAFYSQQGNVAYSNGDEAKALELMRKAYEIKPSAPQNMINYAFLLIKAGELTEAEEILNRVLKTKANSAIHMQAKLNIATIFWLKNEQEEALNLLEEVFKQYKNTVVYGNYGYFKILRGDDLESTLEFNLEAYDFNDNDLTISDNLAQNYYLLGRYEEAKEIYEKVKTFSPKNAEPYYYYALTLEQLGEIEAAKEQIDLAQDKILTQITSISQNDIERLANEIAKQLTALPRDHTTDSVLDEES